MSLLAVLMVSKGIKRKQPCRSGVEVLDAVGGLLI